MDGLAVVPQILPTWWVDSFKLRLPYLIKKESKVPIALQTGGSETTVSGPSHRQVTILTAISLLNTYLQTLCRKPRHTRPQRLTPEPALSRNKLYTVVGEVASHRGSCRYKSCRGRAYRRQSMQTVRHTRQFLSGFSRKRSKHSVLSLKSPN